MGCAASVQTVSFSKVMPTDEAPVASDMLPNVSHQHQLNEGLPALRSAKGTQPTDARHDQESHTHQRRVLEASQVKLQISEQDQVEFDDSKLGSFQSWEPPEDEIPHNQCLPPVRYEHEMNAIRVLRFSTSAILGILGISKLLLNKLR
ncbi:unnamed protein product [Durusdinium trenchii]|uniref:Uncharacterized protein n=1 Tax=Durusdinium trenchii TaxID=1381693 RepID=A0ABP0HTZ1_9DINO